MVVEWASDDTVRVAMVSEVIVNVANAIEAVLIERATENPTQDDYMLAARAAIAAMPILVTDLEKALLDQS